MKKQKLTIKIELTPGSSFQSESLNKSLRLFLQAWAIHAKQNHKKNDVSVSFIADGHPWETSEGVCLWCKDKYENANEHANLHPYGE